MATENVPSFDDLEPVQIASDSEEDDAELIKLEPGENLVGEIREIHRNLGEFNTTLLYIARGLGDTVKMWSNGSIDRQLDAADLGEGDVVGIAKSEEEDTFEDDDGEEVTFYPFEVRSL